MEPYNTSFTNELFLEGISTPSSPSLDVTTMLTHNFLPSDHIRVVILRRIQEYERFLLSLDYEYSLKGNKESFLSIEKTKAQNRLIDLKSILHPIRYVPDDVMLEVFTTVVVSGKESSILTDTDLWACSRVCRRWRALVLMTPSLWSDINLDFDEDIYLKRHLQCAQRLLAKRLNRSGDHLLDVFIRGPRIRPQSNRVLSCVLSSVTRWRSLYVDAGPSVFQVLETCPKRSLKNLQRLTITDSPYAESLYADTDLEDEEDPYADVVFKTFRYTPNLRQFSISPLPLASFLLSANALYNKVKIFSVNLLSQRLEISDLLPMMLALKSVEILCDEEWEDDDDIIHLPSISCLTLSDYHNLGLIPETYNKLDVPNVTILRLAYRGYLSFPPKFPQLRQPNIRIMEFACIIDDLVSINFPECQCELILMLKVLPNIKTLRLSSYNFTPILLEEMRSNLHLCPSLTDVTFIWMCSLTDDDLCLLVDMLYARAVCTTRATIKHIVLEDEVIIYGLSPSKARWDDLCNDGLEVLEDASRLF